MEKTVAQSAGKSKWSTLDMAYIGIFAVLMAVCSWISIPTLVPFTLQTFAVFAALCVLGGRRGTSAILVYILLGAIGVPVFAGFSGGIGVLLTSTGGYIIGFLFAGLIYWGITKIAGEKPVIMVISMLLGMAAYYAFGTVWFMQVYVGQTGPIGLGAALGWCVFPFIIPDLGKMAFAIALAKVLRPHVR